MKNKVSSGKTLLYTNGGGTTIAAGSCLAIGQLLAVAAVDIAAGESGIVDLEGEFDLPKVDAAVIAQGESLTWDVSALSGAGAFDDNLATPATGDITGAAAVAMEGKGATVGATIRVKLTGVPGTKA